MSRAEEHNPHLMKPPSSLQIGLAFAGAIGAMSALLFLAAGRLDWIAGWLYLAVFIANSAINYVYVRSRNPELIEHRMRIGKGTKSWDKVWLVVVTVLFIAIYLVAGLDAGRFEWSTMPPVMWSIGLILFFLGTMLLTWSMAVNPFFEKTVRIQTERGHRVIDTGPYRYVRHPGYVGFFGWIVSAPPLLGSWWAFVPSMLTILAIVVRTALEDRTLRNELPGYVDYAARVRFRLIPGIW